MDRRAFLGAAAAAGALGLSAGHIRPARASSPASDFTWRRFQITTRVTLPNGAAPAQLWLPIAQTASGYQVSLDLGWQSDGTVEPVRDAAYGARILRATWPAGTESARIEVTQLVATRDRTASPAVPLSRAERAFWTAPTETAPTDGIVQETAERIVAGRSDPRERLRALYDWVVDTTWRNPATPGCGLGDIRSMLESRQFGGKCADINGLLVGLCRAAGIPARDVYGIRVADSRHFPSLGKGGDISKAQHCRAEAYLDDTGWFPLDPADVRKVVLEQNLPVDSPEVQALRAYLFGNWEMNWIGYNSATDIELPGATRHRPNFAFLMYPCAFTTGGQPDPLDPARFRYDITSRELPA